MGKSHRLKREAFLEQHPFCCFCGGDAPTEEMDHIPARYLFIDRQWPEGYVFPACAACNDSSSIDEHIMGFVVRIQVSDLSGSEEKELSRALEQIRDRHPALLQGMKELSRTETRRYLRDHGLSPSNFPTEPYILTFPEELFAVPKRYGEKIGKALYYMHTGKILPKQGGVSVNPLTNAQFMSPKFPLERFSVLQQKPILSRSGKSLEGQFSYRYAISDDGRAVAFLVGFRESTAMLLLVYEDRLDYEAAKSLAPSLSNQVT